MTTSQSPLEAIKSQADNIAAMLKAASRGETVANDPAGKIAAALQRESITFGIVMDDKVIKIEMTWARIRATSEWGISAWIVENMRGKKVTKQ